MATRMDNDNIKNKQAISRLEKTVSEQIFAEAQTRRTHFIHAALTDLKVLTVRTLQKLFKTKIKSRS